MNKWMFVSGAVSSTANMFLHYHILGSQYLYTAEKSVSGTPYTWGRSADSAICLGDLDYGGIIGPLGDVRYYYDSFLTAANAGSLLLQRKRYCGEGCLQCISPFQCSACDSGFYLDTLHCKRCNYCCTRCTGPGAEQCTTCAPSCTQSASSCVRKS